MTRGAGKISNYTMDDNLINSKINISPARAFDLLKNFKSLNNRTRGISGENIYSEYANSVVLILNDKNTSTGSGSIISKKNGIALTNWHVVEGAKHVGVVFKSDKAIEESAIHTAEIIGYDATKDLAIIQIAAEVPKNIKELKLSTVYPNVGSDVHAIGHPGSLAWTYTKGYVSQVRSNYEWNYENTTHMASIIQTQTPISPGNSGGPLININGELIGVNSFKVDGENLNFAVSSIDVISFLKTVKKQNKTEAKRKPPKTITKPSKEIDSDKDGIKDTVVFDDDNDGIFDTIVVDSDQDGKVNFVGRDINQDGNIDIFYIDENQDGKTDIWAFDENSDGKIDGEGIDTDGDGEPDKFKKV